MISLLIRIKLLLLKKILSFFLLLLGKVVKIDDKLIIFASFSGTAYSDNPRYLFEYLRDNDDFTVIVLFGLLEEKELFRGLR